MTGAVEIQFKICILHRGKLHVNMMTEKIMLKM